MNTIKGARYITEIDGAITNMINLKELDRRIAEILDTRYHPVDIIDIIIQKHEIDRLFQTGKIPLEK